MFGGFGGLIGSFLVFLLLHSIPPMRRVKQSLINLLGKAGYYILYSLVSTGVLIWLIHEVWAAPYVELWPYEPWAARATAHIMPFSILFFVMGFLRPNPLSIGPGNGFDKTRMGVVGIVRHPILWGFALWAGAHLFANGSLAEVLFFAGLLLLSVGGMFIVDRRKRRLLGEESWNAISSGTSNIPFMGLLKGGNCRPTLKDLFGVILAILSFGLVLWLHPILFNVSPLSGFL
ncbi:NnrU family protein [Kiloniella sp.]|uniref:NnrU family protein n=1 Tax=Kiloniella sp. TaxID=1938587 RepID=UPI003A8D403B